MSPVTIVGMAVGVLVILTALAIFWNKKDFPAGGLGATVVGFALIGMSQWTNVKFKAAGFEFEALQKQVDSTAAAAAVVADEAHTAAAAVEVARTQISALTTQLAARGSVSSQAANAITRSLTAAPRPDTTRLRIATDQLRILNRARPRLTPKP